MATPHCSVNVLSSTVPMGALLCASFLGCAMPVDSTEHGKQSTELVAPSKLAYTSVRDFFDWSGTVWVRTYQCDWSDEVQHPQATCDVEPDFVLVGGGAEIEGSPHPGGLLTGSFPDPGASLTRWVASSKDHGDWFPHRIRAYAIGLRVGNLSATDLRQQISVSDSTSEPAQHPVASLGFISIPPNNHIFVGGGAKAEGSGAGQLLTESYPSDIWPKSWVAASKDHEFVDVGTVTVFLITMAECPWGYNGCLESDIEPQWLNQPAPSGYATWTYNEPAGWAMTSIGGYSDYNGAGRMLTDLVPNQHHGSLQTASVTSKDHVFPDNGVLRPFLVRLRRRP